MSIATIKSKTKLENSLVEKIQKKLGADSLNVSIDPSLVGGFTVEFEHKLYDYQVFSEEKITAFGEIESFSDNVLTINGLPNVSSYEVVVNDRQDKALVMSLKGKIKAVALSKSSFLPGERVYATGKTLSIAVTSKILGRVINPLGEALDKKGNIESKTEFPLEKIAPGIIERTQVRDTLETGTISIDALIPIGKGQRELIIGDRKTGKTSLALSAILNQKGKNVVCVYVAIGQKLSSIAKTIGLLSENEALDYTVVVAASAADSAIINYLAPFSGCAISEYFLSRGRDVLIVYDDLTKHAWSYRELSLLLGRPSGREAYPGDIFYTHSRLLERACKLSKEYGGGSITALPIIETQGGDVSTFIPTNVISITDGQLFLDADQFSAGHRPAISVGNSVSRVGSTAQTKAMKQVASKLRLELSQFRELESFTQFGSEIDLETKKKIKRGEVLTQILIQNTNERFSYEKIICVLWASINGYFDDIDKEKLISVRDLFFADLTHEYQLLKNISEKQEINEEIKTKLKTFVETFVSEYIKNNE